MFEHSPTNERSTPARTEAARGDGGFEGLSLPPAPGPEPDLQEPAALRPAVDPSVSLVSRTVGSAVRLVGRALDWIAADPKAEVSIARAIGALGLDLVPFVGPLKKYADARAMYREGDPLMKDEARRLVVIAAAEAAFDTATLGGSALVPDELLTYMRYARDAHRRVAGISRASSLIPDPLSVAAGALLRLPAVRAAADRALGFAVPVGRTA